MARRVYFAFHYERDIWRVQVVRHSQRIGTSTDYKVAGKYWFDNSLFEEAKKKGAAAVKKMIDDGMIGASVLCVLFGAETYTRPWVKYEILKAMADGMGIFGVYINRIENQKHETDDSAPTLFGKTITYNEQQYKIPNFPVYGWNRDDGRTNLGTWAERAAKTAGR
jgi:hypothetical protein